MSRNTSPRGHFAVILPSTNTVVEAEYQWMLVPGVSWHSSRIYIPNPKLDSDEAFESFSKDLKVTIADAVKSVMTCKPDYMVMGMSSETFWGGKTGATSFEAWMRELSGLDVTTGAASCNAALDVFGAKRIGVITPYQPVGDEQVRNYFTEMDYIVKSVYGLKCDSATSIAETTPEQIKAAFRAVDGPDVDVLVQAGTNLPAALVAAEMEIELGKSIVPVNTATVWHAYRTHGIMDQITGFGSLLEKH
ncbi:uncharacterized protein BDZ99DRAFT_460404 [Mytilinidion resinicola]|uniref:Asp/Glu racemase n=1 Tax=Mytilinidion resinicola TaxID=574789 RepID=A0A6A6YYV0_9PEZI|nr:uncharacterized protein BDZ99DRAFT_460404 [Mytilinidion resinicola]KAF2813105.1 hypothetical protein BDZ99DRAFT_460404 [Mytilinidion resinicola]